MAIYALINSHKLDGEHTLENGQQIIKKYG